MVVLLLAPPLPVQVVQVTVVQHLPVQVVQVQVEQHLPVQVVQPLPVQQFHIEVIRVPKIITQIGIHEEISQVILL